MGRKRTTEDTERLINNLGYILLEEYLGENKRRKVVIQDSFGYKYDVDFYNLICKNYKIKFVHKGNPFTLNHNIPLWLSLNRPEFELHEDNKYLGSDENLLFNHDVCGESFYSTWSTIYQGGGCGVCHGLQVGEKNSLFFVRPDLVAEWHPSNKDSPKKVTVFSHKKVYWICSKCGYGKNKEWLSRIADRSSGRGCISCIGRVINDENRLSTLYPEIASEWHPNKNGNLTPENFSYGSNKKIWWVCSNCSYEWNTDIYHRIKGTGCPKCSSSKGEEVISNFLVKHKISFQIEVPLDECKHKRQLYLDFYLPDYSIAIEYNGDHHYKPVRFSYSISEEKAKENLKEQKKKDKIKEDYCKDNNIRLIIIPYWEFDNIGKILGEVIF